jgi:hypothetical protein
MTAEVFIYFCFEAAGTLINWFSKATENFMKKKMSTPAAL